MSRYVLFALVVGAVALGLAGPAVGQAAPTPSTADRALLDLQAADAARAELVREDQAWADERASLELLADAVESEAKRLAAEAAEARARAANLRTQAADVGERGRRLAAVLAAFDALARRVESALDDVRAHALPGLVPEADVLAGADGAERLTAALRRLDEAEHQARRAAVELVAGELAGQAVTVRLLRAGAVAAWWVSLDGSRAGTARVQQGRVVLTPAPTADAAARIRTAVAVAQGHLAPRLVTLPVPAEGLR